MKPYPASFQLAVAAALVLGFFSINILPTECASIVAVTADSRGCNATSSTISECLTEEEEWMMESESSRRLLAGQQRKVITYDAPKPKKPFCNRDVYGSCIPGPSKFFDERACNSANSCKRQAV